jgi:hypothetical protein
MCVLPVTCKGTGFAVGKSFVAMNSASILAHEAVAQLIHVRLACHLQTNKPSTMEA